MMRAEEKPGCCFDVICQDESIGKIFPAREDDEKQGEE
jgi:hypothetical protein